MAQPIIKEIIPGVSLIKTSEKVPGSNTAKIIFEVEIKNVQSLEFSLDLSGSSGVKIEGQEAGELKQTTIVKPFKKTKIGTIFMEGNGVMKMKYGIKEIPVPLSEQQEHLKDEFKKINSLKQKHDHLLKLFAFELSPIEEIQAKVKTNNINFYDITFPPTDSSAFDLEEEKSYPFQNALHWRRADEFLLADKQKGLRDAAIFYQDIEPNDIKQGTLGNCWFMCALASLAERPKLVEKLFETKIKNEEGVYRIKICKNGEWVSVTVDDYFPCLPYGNPMFSRAHDNEMWVLLLEKAYAKLHGNYYTLRGGYANEGMIDLTGCPSTNYQFDHPKVKAMIDSGEFWIKLLHFDKDGYLISASTPGEDRWTETGGPNKEGGLVPGHAYSVISVVEALGNKLINIRNPWGSFEWDGDWSDKSPLWTPEMIKEVKPVLDEKDGTFWMNFEDFIQHFSGLNVCRARNWQEHRIRGKFLRVKDSQDQSQESVLSKWYYELEIEEATRIFIGVHQEDERIQGVVFRRPYIDASISVLKVDQNENLELIDYSPLAKERQVELEVELQPGKYVVLPRTTGIKLSKPAEVEEQPATPLIDHEGNLTKIFQTVVDDIFRKFDLYIGRELSFEEFKVFYQCTGQALSQQYFQSHIMQKHCSTKDGVTVRGLQHFFQDSIKQYGEAEVRIWLKRLGYDKHLFNVESRAFTLTFHSALGYNVTARDASRTELDNIANAKICLKDLQTQGLKKDFINKKDYQIIYSFSEDLYAYTYAAQNLSKYPQQITLDFTKNSQNMMYLPKEGKITKVVQPGDTQFMIHTMADPNQESFIKKCIASMTWV